MVEQTDKGWLTVLEEQGLHQAAHILENYGIEINVKKVSLKVSIIAVNVIEYLFHLLQ
jgi:hypothetical protein